MEVYLTHCYIYAVFFISDWKFLLIHNSQNVIHCKIFLVYLKLQIAVNSYELQEFSYHIFTVQLTKSSLITFMIIILL